MSANVIGASRVDRSRLDIKHILSMYTLFSLTEIFKVTLLLFFLKIIAQNMITLYLVSTLFIFNISLCDRLNNTQNILQEMPNIP